MAGSRRLAKDSRSAHKPDGQEPKPEKEKDLGVEYQEEGREKEGNSGEAQAWPSSGLPSAAESQGGAYALRPDSSSRPSLGKAGA